MVQSMEGPHAAERLLPPRISAAMIDCVYGATIFFDRHDTIHQRATATCMASEAEMLQLIYLSCAGINCRLRR